KDGVALVLGLLGDLDYRQGDYASARTLMKQSLTVYKECANSNWRILYQLHNLADVELACGNHERAVHLWGASQSLRDKLSIPLRSDERDEHDRHITAAREALGENAFALAWAEGREMMTTQAVAYALQEDPQ